MEKNNGVLSIDIIQKMTERLLTDAQISQEVLVETLGVNARKLKRIRSSKASLATIAKINLPLIKLYCKTFNN